MTTDGTQYEVTTGALTESLDSVLRAAFEYAPFEVWLRDADDRCIMQNAAARRWGDMIGLRTKDSNLPSDLRVAWEANNRRAFGGELVQSEAEFQVGDEKRHYQCVVVPIRDGGLVHSIVAFNIDITDRVRAEQALRESERRLREALRVGRMGYLDWNLVTNEIQWSPETYRLFGHVPGAFSPTIDATVGMVPPEDRAFVQERLDAVIRGTAEYDIDHRMVRPDGQVIHVHAQGEVMRDDGGRPLRMLGTVIDVTERRRAEEERKRAEEDLREVDRRRRDFLSVLSHELRNPLAPIRNSLYLLERVPPGGDQARRALAIIGRQVSHLSRLVDDLLDVTRISSGKIRLHLERLDIVELVRRTVDDHGTLLADRQITVDVPRGPIWVRGDATRLAQVLGNVLSNAAKFTPEDGKVAVYLQRVEGRAVLQVVDTGLGIDAETLERLFVPFAQADRSLDRSLGGLGLGLALVKALVEMHGGKVSARSEGPQRGACFTIELPCDEPDDSAIEQLPRGNSGCAGRKVLVVEDNRDSARSLASALELSGHEVIVAFDGATGLAKAREVVPDVVLCDIGLPGAIDGYAVARALRQDAVLASAYRVALTGYALPEDQAMAREAGFDAHLAKPTDLVALEKLLAEVPRARSPAEVGGEERSPVV